MNYIHRMALALIVAVIPSLAGSAPLVTSITFRTFDADTGDDLVARIYINNTLLLNGKYVPDQDADSQIAIEVHADAGSQYYRRNLTIFMEGLKLAKPIYNIYLAKSGRGSNTYTRGLVKVASEKINVDSVDQAVALLERINEESSPSQKATQFGVYLRYNLARAYLLNCTQRFVNQCQNAKSIFDDLYNNYETQKRFFSAESISKQELQSIDVESYYKKMTYLKAKWDLSCGRFEEALGTFEELITEAEDDPSLLKRLNLTIEGLKNDRALVKTKIALVKG